MAGSARTAARDRLLGSEGKWIMGRVIPRELLEGVGAYVDLVAPARDDELIEAIQARAEELVEADRDMIVDAPSEGALAVSAVVLAAFETLRPLFDGDERRTIVYLQRVTATVLRRPYEVRFSTLSQREDPLDKIERLCRGMEGLYGSGWDFDFRRPDPGTFEMNVRRCHFHDVFVRHDVPLLTTVLCAFDVNFLQAIDPAVSGLRAEHASLLSLGDDHCRFAVLETGDPLAGYTDKLDQRFADGGGRGAD